MASPLWQCLSHHFDEFLEAYKERFQPSYGFLRPIISEVVEKFLECGDLARGFARIRCDRCKEDRLLAFSCRGPLVLPVLPPEKGQALRGAAGRVYSLSRCRTGISCSASPRCSARTSATTAICSKISAASPTSA